MCLLAFVDRHQASPTDRDMILLWTLIFCLNLTDGQPKMNHGGHTRTLDEKRYQCHGNHDQDLTKYHLKDNDYGVTLHVVPCS